MGRLMAHADYDKFIMETNNIQINDKRKAVYIEVRSNSTVEDAMTPANQAIKIMRTNSFVHLSSIDELGKNWLTFDVNVGQFIQHPGTTQEELNAYKNQVEMNRQQYVEKIKVSYQQADIFRGSCAPVQ